MRSDNPDQSRNVGDSVGRIVDAPMSRAQFVVGTYARIARPLMLHWMHRNSCIAATRITRDVLAHFDIEVEPFPVKWIVQVPSLHFAYLSGFRGEEKEDLRRKAFEWQQRGIGWDGHLIAVADKRWLIDASVDQCDAPERGFAVPPSILVVDLAGMEPAWSPQTAFLGKFTSDTGIEFDMQYVPIDDAEYFETEAWQDEGLERIGALIVQRLHEAIR